MELQREVKIARPVAEVFAFVSDPGNLPAWQPSVAEVRREPGEPAAGSRFTEVRQFMGKRFESTVEIAELEPQRVFTIRVVDGPVPVTIRHGFEESDGGTRLTLSGRAEPRGAMRFAAAAMTRAADHEAKGNLARLKALLESR